MKRISALASAFLLLAGLAGPAQAMEMKEFLQKFNATSNSWERKDLIGELNPNDKKSRKVLYAILTQPRFDWYMRLGAINAFSKVDDAKVLKEMKKTKPNKKPLLAEAFAMAFGQSGSTDHVPYMLDCLKSKKEIVRRAAAIALRNVPHKSAIPALIEAWEEEDKFTVWVHILETLEKITFQTDLNGMQAWKDWWTVNQDSFDFETAKAEAAKKDGDGKSGEVIKTRVRGTNLTMRSRGKGLPLLVLPDISFEQDYLETYLRNLEKTNQILYMRLPAIRDFTDPPIKKGTKDWPQQLPKPYYPLERIGDAFEGLQKELVKEGKIKGKFAILAHGLSCWLAMKFAEKHPKAVRRMILIGGHSGGKAAGEGIKRIITTGQKRGDLEMEHYGKSRQFDGQAYGYTAQGEDDQRAMSRKGFTVRFGDQRNLTIARLYGPLELVLKKVDEQTQARVPLFVRADAGGSFIPDFSVFKMRKVPVPTMIMVGKGSIEASIEDSNQIAKFYGKYGRVYVFKRSGEMPFIEENETFTKIARKWLKK
jgi:pimeloyl-ACP methyl ester carboxylesterase